jgi:hypothetical protein
VVSLLWGMNWPTQGLVLREVSPWTLRAATLGAAGVILVIVNLLRGESLRVRRGDWMGVIVFTLLYMVHPEPAHLVRAGRRTLGAHGHRHVHDADLDDAARGLAAARTADAVANRQPRFLARPAWVLSRGRVPYGHVPRMAPGTGFRVVLGGLRDHHQALSDRGGAARARSHGSS